jgi:hypothetical protein
MRRRDASRAPFVSVRRGHDRRARQTGALAAPRRRQSARLHAGRALARWWRMQLVRHVRPPHKPWVIATLVYMTGIVTWVYLLATVPRRVFCCYGGESKLDITRLTVKKLAYESLAEWRSEHPGKLCPPSIEALVVYSDHHDLKDLWGSPYVLACDPATGRQAVISPGEDGKFGTPDDVRSGD